MMGDRGQIKIKIDKSAVFLYTHWGGSELNATLANALDRGRGRWSDTEYLIRIIFNEMTKGDEMSETGYGIGLSQHGDIEYPIPELDDDKGEITFLKAGYGDQDLVGKKFTYEEFIKKFKPK